MIASRRAFLTGGIAAGASLFRPPIRRRVGGQPRFASDPFTLGVASGYPLPAGVVLWTRLAPAPLMPGGGMARDVVPVDWEIATDDRMSNVVQRGRTGAAPEWGHA